MGSSKFSEKVATETKAITDEVKNLGEEIKEGAEHAVESLKEKATEAFDKIKGLFGHHENSDSTTESK